MAGQNAAPLLKVEGLKQYFRVSKSYTVKAVDNVSFEIYPRARPMAGGRVRFRQVHHHQAHYRRDPTHGRERPRQ